MSKKYLISVVGPTAVGKTSVSIQLAQALKTEVLSADSRQFYRELEIGTAKPDAEELIKVPHHFINSLSINDSYDVGQYESEALKKLDELFKEHDAVILVGGSGLFVDAVCNGLDDLPEVKKGVREALNNEFKRNGLEKLNEELKSLDPEYHLIVDQKNPQRVIRALEVIRSTGKSFSSFRKRKPAPRPFEVISIGLELDRQVLYDRIDSRMDQMIAAGLFEEAERFLPYSELNALQTVGYTEIFGFLKGRYDQEEAVRLLKRNSRRYAKRQLTWFKRNENTQWFDPNDYTKIEAFVMSKLEGSKTK
ncbi:tRNA (adenosine(37)-N6)-dimethylallyltransferase MiaA [Roseivirga sp. 4D4]|uniref:tRNA (adenosine(37)-N6)-dimethylallyltransferase MiaA n=1 Tax=Roseivirga sp. 4D4 TaxID=1889784 RepID=UPI0008538358|nr:tRNA (adenosine(37)-N6)-dimethylallyltransferase MiaA [Roseivirga sp. 4D4]OEK00341.1 tRNA (adenosine(37)-N6)-dimethylallyltransferase MiaA [Roseivirga sp. 4D4]